jgi:ABC-type phosphate transport system substrate-binding protein
MKHIKILLITVLIAWINIASINPSEKNSAPLSELAIIVNAENPVTTMTASQVKLTYLRKINKRWKELNKNIMPVDRKSDNEVRKAFLKEIVQLSSDEMARYFTEREYQNAEAPPVKLSSDEEIIEYVENNIGAIGFVSKSSVKSSNKVKVVLSL